jgi:hypothetical protein
VTDPSGDVEAGSLSTAGGAVASGDSVTVSLLDAAGLFSDDAGTAAGAGCGRYMRSDV